MTPLLYLLGVVLFVLAILASIGLHELGHMIPAKAFGGKVTQYFIGFGPTVWSRQRGETEYGVKAIPLGGYVKIVGMLPPDEEHADKVEYDADGNRVMVVRKSNTGMFGQLVSDARAAEWETITAADEDRLFYKMAWWKKVVVMAGGPTVNLMIAFLSSPACSRPSATRATRRSQTKVDVVSACIVPAAEEGRACTPSDPVSPAAKAGLKPGDRFVSFNGTPIQSWDQMQTLIRGNNDGQATIVVDRAGQTLTLHTDTLVEPRPTDPDDPQKLTPVGFLGVAPVVTYTTGGVLYTVEQMGGLAKQSAVALATLPVKVWGVGPGDRRRQGPRRGQPRQHRRRRTDRRRDRLRPGLPAQGQADRPPRSRRRVQLLHRPVQLHPAAAARRRPHRRCALGGRSPRDRPAARTTRSRLRRRRQAPARGVRRGQLPARDGRGPDRGRPRRPRERDLTRLSGSG